MQFNPLRGPGSPGPGRGPRSLVPERVKLQTNVHDRAVRLEGDGQVHYALIREVGVGEPQPRAAGVVFQHFEDLAPFLLREAVEVQVEGLQLVVAEC